MSDLVKTARRAEGSDLLPKVSFGVMNAEVLILRMAARIEALEVELFNARAEARTAIADAYRMGKEAQRTTDDEVIKKLRNALTTYENKVREYASDDWACSDNAYDWLNEDAGKTARAALMEDQNDDPSQET